MNMTTCSNHVGRKGGTALTNNGASKLVQKALANLALLSLLVLGLALAGCGGGSGGTVSSQVVSGTASVGAPLAGQVTLKDSSSPAQQRSTVIDSDGSFAIDVTSLKAPFVLQAKGSAGGASYTLHSFAEGEGTANVNPLSDAIVASAAGVKDSTEVFDHADSEHNDHIKSNLAGAVSAILAKLQPLLQRYSADHTNPITAHYIANHLGMDDMFDNVRITVSNGTLSIVNAKTGAVIFSGLLTDIANGVFNGSALPPAGSAPAAPGLVSAVGASGQVTLSWSAVSGATSYNLYYSTSSSLTTATGTKLASVTTPYVQTGLAAGTTYYYLLTAVNASGESTASPSAQATTASATPTPTVPAAPTGVSATGGTKQVTLSWPAVSGATSYNVYWATASGVTKTSGTKIAGATSPAVQTGLAAGTSYYYVVSAVNGVGESAASAQVSATTLSATPTPTPTPALPAAPAGLGATGGANQMTLSWSAVTGATSYNVYWATTSGVTKASGAKIAGATAPYVQTGLTAGTTYYYIVSAVNGAGEGAASAQVSGATAAAFDALAYYDSVCLGCHGSLGVRSAAQISSAISGIGSMKSLSTLTAAQVSAIAAVSH